MHTHRIRIQQFPPKSSLCYLVALCSFWLYLGPSCPIGRCNARKNKKDRCPAYPGILTIFPVHDCPCSRLQLQLAGPGRPSTYQTAPSVQSSRSEKTVLQGMTASNIADHIGWKAHTLQWKKSPGAYTYIANVLIFDVRLVAPFFSRQSWGPAIFSPRVAISPPPPRPDVGAFQGEAFFFGVAWVQVWM